MTGDRLTIEITRRVQDGILPRYPVRLAPTPDGTKVLIEVTSAGDAPCDACQEPHADYRVGSLHFHTECHARWVQVCEASTGEPVSTDR